MKKTVAAAVAAAVVVGTSATTFAAINPFSDVPRGHWSYKAVQSLVDEGIIEGYGDGTFRGDRPITRYEMAQMIAKALAKTDANFAQKSGLMSEVNKSLGKVDGGNPVIHSHGSGSDAQVLNTGRARGADALEELKALIVEYRPELENLGATEAIRAYLGDIEEMWKFHDKVKWEGKIEYTYKNHKTDNVYDDGHTRVKQDDWIFRFEPTMEVNKHWTLKARIDAHVDMSRNANNSFELVRGWAHGDYGKLQLNVGRQPLYTNEDGIVWDTEYTGADLSYGSKWKATFYGGRLNKGTVAGTRRHAGAWDGRQDGGDGESRFFKAAGAEGILSGSDPSSFWAANVQYDPGETATGFFGGGGYYQVKDDDLRTIAYTNDGNTDKANIWSANLGYKFGGKAKLWGSYARNTKADFEDRSWQAILSYGVKKDANGNLIAGGLYGGGNQGTTKGQWAVWAGYKELGSNTSLCAINWDDCFAGTKGFVAGFSVAPMDRVVFLAKYFKGKYITGNGDAERLFGRVEFFY